MLATRRLVQHLMRFLKSEEGPTATEYAVMLAFIVVICLTAFRTLGQNASHTFSFIAVNVSSS